MTSALRNSMFILALAVLLPITIFTGIEIASLNENEKMLEQVYREQLDGIIFSINQYGADIHDFYTKQVDYAYNKGGVSALSQPDAIEGNLIIDFIALKDDGKVTKIDLNEPSEINLNVDSIFQNNSELIARLIRYKETGYIKQEVIKSIVMDNQVLQISLIIIGSDTPCLLFLNPVSFIEDLLAPKIQQITTQTINVSIVDSLSLDTVYQSAYSPIGIIQTGSVAKAPGYEIAVSLQTQSVSDLIAYRTRRNLLALSAMVGVILIGMILIIRNLRKEAQLNKVKTDFIANVSHEIRTPLSLISMFNETLLLGRVKEDRKKEYYEIISKETSRLKNIVNKILSFSQIDANKKSFHLIEMDPNKKIEDIMNSYSYHLTEKGFKYNLNLHADKRIQADEEAFSEVIINLIDNGVKYSKKSKYIEIESFTEGSWLVIKVKDHGVGIDKKHQKSIFEKFYRVDGGDIHNTKGTGLGLALVAEIMKEHNATIDVESQIAQGSTFILKFPII